MGMTMSHDSGLTEVEHESTGGPADRKEQVEESVHGAGELEGVNPVEQPGIPDETGPAEGGD